MGRLVSLNAYDNKEGVFGRALRLQIMELRKRVFRFDLIGKAARERKDAPCGGRLSGLAALGVSTRLNASQGGYLAA